MASKPSPSRQHKYLAVLIDVDDASITIAKSLIESNETVDELRVVHPMNVRTTCQIPAKHVVNMAERNNI